MDAPCSSKSLSIGAPQSLDGIETDLNDAQHRRTYHIPYILNGELYEIQNQNGEHVTVKCCHCPPDRVYRGSVRSTGNFHMHIKRRHSDLLGKLHDMKVTALLERRDRILKNRKTTQKPKSDVEPKREFPQSESQTKYSHKLKIKTVFQRHQEQAALQNCNNTESHDDTARVNEVEKWLPINYSTKSNALTQQIRDVDSINFGSNTDSLNIQTDQPATTETHMDTIELNNNATDNNDSSTGTNNFQQEPMTIIHQNDRYDGGMNVPPALAGFLRQYTDNALFFDAKRRFSFPLGIVKNEHTVSQAAEAIDLTQKGDNCDRTPCVEPISPGSMSSNLNVGVQEDRSSQFEQLVLRMDTSLRQLQEEMRIRNQIENNRIYLELAKFKFLNPGFTYQI